MIKAAVYYEKLDRDRVWCHLCPAECKLTEGKHGICRSRFNEKGRLVTDNYGEAVTVAVDPIEKKPLYHFYPGTDILSTGPNCCNLKCSNCQNWTISQKKSNTMYVAPEKLVALAAQHDSLGVAFTYTEPLVWYEYIMDTAPLLRRAGLKVVLVSNGYISREPFERMLEVIDAINIDLKAIRPDFYLRVCKGRIAPILENIKLTAASPVHLEVTNLIIPGLNDSDEDLAGLVDFIASVSDMIPLHFSAYRPDYKMDIPSTPNDTMLRAWQIAIKKLKYVYLGNVALDGYADTYCPRCRNPLVRRSWYRAEVTGLDGDRCGQCGFATRIVR